MKKFIGYSLIVSPFIAIACLSLYWLGLFRTFGIFGTAILITVVLGAGAYLIQED